MQRLGAAALLLALVVALTVGPADVPADGKKDKKGGKANDGVVSNWGKPKDFGAGKVTAIWVWYDDGVWHLRTTGGGKGSHRFQGVIEVAGGRLSGIKGGAGEFRGKNADRFIFNREMTAIAFDFKTDEGVDGLNFGVDRAATGLKFTLALDGESHPRHIRVGKAGDHPAGPVFTAPAHPADPPPGKKDAKGKKK